MATARKTRKWADSPATIAARRRMDVTVVSSSKLTLQAVTYDELMLNEAMPNDLVVAAILEEAEMMLPQMLNEAQNGNPEKARDLARARVELQRRVCKLAIIDPEPTDELLDSLDGFDLEMIAQIAQRKRATDATGKVVAAQSLADFTRFREVGDGAEGGEEGPADGAE